MNQNFKSDLVIAYDRDALERDKRTLPDERVWFRKKFVELVRREGRSKLIEFGAGAGQDAAALMAEDLNVVAMDLSPENVEKCRARGIEAHIGDFYDLNLPDGAYEIGWAMSTLLHVPNEDIDEVLDEIIRVLEPGAPLAIGVWGGVNHEGVIEDDWADPPRFFSRRTDLRLREILERHGTVETFETGMHDSEDGHYQWCVLRTPS